MKLIHLFLWKVSQAKGWEKGSDEYQVMEYGLQSFLLIFVKTVILLTIAYKLSILPEMLYYVAVLCFIKFFSLGIHFDPILCAVMCVIYFFGGVYMAHLLPFQEKAASLVFLVCFILNVRYAPSQTVNRTIELPEEVIRQKLMTLISIFVVYALIPFLPTPVLKNLNVAAVLVETFTVLPVTYRVFHVERPENKKIGGYKQ